MTQTVKAAPVAFAPVDDSAVKPYVPSRISSLAACKAAPYAANAKWPPTEMRLTPSSDSSATVGGRCDALGGLVDVEQPPRAWIPILDRAAREARLQGVAHAVGDARRICRKAVLEVG